MPVLEDKTKVIDTGRFDISTAIPVRQFDISSARPLLEEEKKVELRAAPELTIMQRIGRLFEAPEGEKQAKHQVAYAINEMLPSPKALSPKEKLNRVMEIEENLPAYTKKLGLRDAPTTEELVSTAIMFPVMAGFATHPLGTLAGIGGFMALDEIENFVVGKIQKEPYRFGESRGLKEFLPEQTAQDWKDMVDLADFIAKGAILGGIYRKVPQVKEALFRISSEKYNMPKTVYIEPAKVKSIFRTGEEISPYEMELVKELGLTGKQYKAAIDKGITIEVPAERIVNIVDKPFWAKIKGLFKIKPTAETRILRVNKPIVAPVGYLEGKTLPAPAGMSKIKPETAQIGAKALEVTPEVEAKQIIAEIEKAPEIIKEPSIVSDLKEITEKINTLRSEGKSIPNSILKRQQAIIDSFQGGQAIDIKKAPPSVKKILGIKEPMVTIKEKTLLAERLKAIARGAREGKVFTKQEIKITQTKIIESLEASELEPKDKAKFLRTIKNVQTQQQLIKALPEIQERIGELERVAEKRALITDIKSETQKTKLKKLRPEFQQPIMDLIDSIDIEPRSDRKIRNLQKTLDFLVDNPDNEIPLSKINELKRLSDTPIRDMSVEDLQSLSNSINHLVKLNELKNKIIIKRKLKEFKEATNEAVKNINTRHEKLNGSLDGLDSMQEELEKPLWQKIWGVDSINAELKSEILDGEENGIIKQIIYNEIDNGVAEQFKVEHTAEDFFKEKLKGINIDNWSRYFQAKEANVEKVSVKISGERTIKMTKGERVAFLLHEKNTRNLKHLNTGGFAFEKTPSKIIKITSEDINAIVASATPEEIKTADAISEYLNTIQKDKLNKISVDINGFEIATENNYWHIRTDYLDRIKEVIIKKGNYSQKTLEGMGPFLERQDASNALILEDAFSALYKSIKLSASYIGLAKPLRGAKGLLNDNDFLISASNIGKTHYINSLKDYIAKIEGESIRLDNLEKLTTEWINKLDTSILGLNPFVALKQRISWFMAGTEMDFDILSKYKPKKPSAELIEEIKEYSPHLRDRLDGNVTRELGEVAQVGRIRKFFTGQEASLKLQTIRDNDTMVITAIWEAVKEEVSLRPGPKLEGEKFLEAVAERAWKVIRRTQPTFHIKDRSTIGMSKNVFTRLLTKYSSQRNKNWIIIRRALERYNRSGKTSGDKADLMKRLFTVTIVNSLAIVLINTLRRVVFSKSDKKKLFKNAIIDFFLTPLANLYVLGDFVSSLISKIDKGTYGGYDIENPVTSTVNEITDTLAEGTRAIGQAITSERYVAGEKKGQEKWITSLKKFAEGAFDIAGRIVGVNLKNIREFFKIPFRVFGKEKKSTRPKIGG